MFVLDFARLLLGTAFLGVAAVSDLRSRTVKDRLWIVMGTVGLVLFGADLFLQNVDPVIGLVLVPAAVLMYDPLIGQEFRTASGWRFPPGSIGAYLIALGSLAFAAWDLREEPVALDGLARYLTVPVMMLVFRGMYEVHLLKGGADAKGLIVLAAFVPQYPNLPPFPVLFVDNQLGGVLGVLFPFSLLVLLNAALLFAVGPPIAFLIYNVAKGHVEFPMTLLGYKVPLDRVPRYAWFMDQIVDGEHVVVYFPAKRQDREAITKALRTHGFREAWVTPQLPFMIAIALGYVIAFVLGNPLMALLRTLLPVR